MQKPILGVVKKVLAKTKTVNLKINNLFYRENRNNSNCRKTSSYSINLSGNPVSCLIKIGKCKARALVDSGAEVSLLH
jgi:hypothetical protein